MCFKLEARRDALLTRFERPRFLTAPLSFALRALLGELCMESIMGNNGGAPELPPLKTSDRPDAPWRGLKVDLAPEPRDIYWENLVSDGIGARRLTVLVTLLLIALGVLLSLATKSAEAVFSRDEAGIFADYTLTKEYGLPLLSTAFISLVNFLLKVRTRTPLLQARTHTNTPLLRASHTQAHTLSRLYTIRRGLGPQGV